MTSCCFAVTSTQTPQSPSATMSGKSFSVPLRMEILTTCGDRGSRDTVVPARSAAAVREWIFSSLQVPKCLVDRARHLDLGDSK